LDTSDASSTIIVRVASADERHAHVIIVLHRDKDYAFTDATSFAVMEQLGTSQAFALDDHFIQHGFSTLTQESER